MMKRLIVSLSLILLAGDIPLVRNSDARGDDRPSTGKDAVASLAPFEGEWTIDAHWASGEPLQARGVYSWGLGKTILKTQTFVKNGASEYQRYEGVFAWHPKKKQLFQISFAYDGGMTEVLVENKGKDTLLIGWSPFDDAQPSNVRQTITLTDPDTFTWKVELREDAAWKTLIEAPWHRKK